jgi:DNA gyrase subunit A
VAGITCVEPNDELILITQKGKMLRMISRDIRPIGRATQGVRLIEIGKKDVVVSMAKLVERDEETADDVEQTVESLES